MQCCQLALSTIDLTRTHWWYQRALGFAAAGERRERGGPAFAAVPGLPECSLDVWCLVGRQPFMQIEMIQFTRPIMRPRRPSWRRSDIGYSTVGIHVPDFDAAVGRVHMLGGDFITEPIGTFGKRRVCLSDPDDTLIELMEDSPAGSLAASPERQASPAIACVSLTVRNIDRALRFWVDDRSGGYGADGLCAQRDVRANADARLISCALPRSCTGRQRHRRRHRREGSYGLSRRILTLRMASAVGRPANSRP